MTKPFSIVAGMVVISGAVIGCKPETKPVPPATVVITGCQYFPRLTASKRDTDETKEEILAYLTVYDKVCGKKP